MAHIGGEKRQLRLDVVAGAIPAEYDLHGKAMTDIMHAWAAARGSGDRRAVTELAEAGTKPLSRI